MATTTRGRRRLLTLFISASLVLAVLVGNATATTQVAGHEIEADLETNTDAEGDTDWAPNTDDNGGETALFDASASSTCTSDNSGRPGSVISTSGQATLICDSVSFPGQPDTNVFSGGAKEDDPDSQTTTSSPVTPKTDLTNAYARGVIDASNDAWVIAAYEVIPKQGSYHTNVEFNQKVKCVTQGIIVDQADDCNGTEQVVPFRTAGDALLAVDIGGSNDPDQKIRLLAFIAEDHDSNPATNAVYNFGKNAQQTLANANFSATGAASIDEANAKVFLNGATIDCGPWGCYDEGYNFVSQLPAEAFVEVAFNLSAFTENVCLNNVAFKSRASGQSVTSQLKDTTDEQPFPFCGGLSVRKYIDSNESGSEDAGDVAAVGDDLAGWNFTVVGPAPSLDVVCSGTTDSSGDLVCTTGDLTQLAPGDYTVTETNAGAALSSNSADTINTDPALGTSKVVTVGLGGSVEEVFGNTCLISKTFNVTGVPNGATPFATYDTTPDNDPFNDDTVVTLTQDGSTWSATTDHLFRGGDSIEVGFGVGSERVITGTDTFSAVDDGYPDCNLVNTIPFSPGDITIQKLKDVTADGVSGDDFGLNGWDFTITGPGHESGTTVTTATDDQGTADTSDDEDGIAVLGNLAPGDYTITETLQANWDLTGIVGGTGACDPSTPCVNSTTVSVSLTGPNNSVSVQFANAPLSDLDVRFFDLTGHTDAQSISCVDGEGDPVGSGSSSASQPESTHEVSGVQTGTYVCTIVIIDP